MTPLELASITFGAYVTLAALMMAAFHGGR